MVAIAVFIGMPGAYLWLISDMSTGLPIFANLITIAVLTPTFLKLLKDYKARYMGIGQIDPNMALFYEDKARKEEKARKENA